MPVAIARPVGRHAARIGLDEPGLEMPGKPRRIDQDRERLATALEHGDRSLDALALALDLARFGFQALEIRFELPPLAPGGDLRLEGLERDTRRVAASREDPIDLGPERFEGLDRLELIRGCVRGPVGRGRARPAARAARRPALRRRGPDPLGRLAVARCHGRDRETREQQGQRADRAGEHAHEGKERDRGSRLGAPRLRAPRSRDSEAPPPTARPDARAAPPNGRPPAPPPDAARDARRSSRPRRPGRTPRGAAARCSGT